MSKIITAIKLLKSNRSAIFSVIFEKVGCFLPDKLYLRILFRIRMGYKLDLNNPKTFSEKIQWLKLYDRKPRYTALVDKYLVKDIVADIIGKEHIIPTIGVWNSPESIEWDKLPKQFVLKTTHGGGNSGVVICKDKRLIDKLQVIDKLKKSLKQDIYKTFREWPYKNVNKRIIAEKYMEQEDGSQLIDYKFFCFNGQPKYVYFRHEDKGDSKVRLSFLDMNWKLAPFHNPEYPQFCTLPPKPLQFCKMVDIAAKLCQGHSFLRVDLYVINDQIYFSEITFFPGTGMMPFEPKEWDWKLGYMIDL